VFSTTAPKRGFATKAAEHDALLCEQEDAVRAVNFPLSGRWVSTECMDASTARLSTVSLSSLHAFAGPETSNSGRDVSVPTMRARFLCWHVPEACFKVLASMFVDTMFIASILLGTHPDFGFTCAYTIVVPCCLVAVALAAQAASIILASVLGVATVEISADGRFWKVERSLTSPPFRLMAPLDSCVLWRTRVVAEGSTDDLQGCEV
jgi:hypothetical protein